MKLRTTSCALLWLMMTTIPAFAGVVYNNGPDPGNIHGWEISDGYAVTDSFTLTSATTLSYFEFSEWVLPGDRPTYVTFAITSQPFGGTTYVVGYPFLGVESSSTNSFGYTQDVVITVDPLHLQLPAGTYWLQLYDATTEVGQPAYWGENDGQGCTSPGCPSLAYENDVGSIGSESFDMVGTPSGTPEPSSIVLLASGVIASIGVMRRKGRPSSLLFSGS
jgi:hypothetical protein